MPNLADQGALHALTVHADHVNKHDGSPYTLHLYRVSSALRAAGESDLHIAAGWLHDSIEDEKTTYQAVYDINPRLAAVVLCLSKPSDGSLTLVEYYNRLLTDEVAARVKIFDIFDNFGRNHLIEDDEKRLRMAKKYSLGLDILKDYRG
jgi:hypothetical protein